MTDNTDCDDNNPAVHSNCSNLPTVTLFNTPPPPPPGSNEGYTFSAGQKSLIAPPLNNPDFGVVFVNSTNAMLLKPDGSVGALDLGVATLEATTTVPATGYSYAGPGATPIPIQLGHVYAFKLPGNSHAAIEFTEIAVPIGGGTSTRSTFRYKYPITVFASGLQLVSYGFGSGGFDGFDFSTGSVTSNPDPFSSPNPLTDFYIETNSIWLGDNVEILSLGNTVALSDVDTVPSTGYVGPSAWGVAPSTMAATGPTVMPTR